MADNNKSLFWGAITGLAAMVGIIAVKQLTAVDAESCPDHMKRIVSETKMREIILDLKLNLVPYYHHYYNLVKALEDEYISKSGGNYAEAMKSATLYELKQKLKKELEEKQRLIEEQVIVQKHEIT